jgi:glycogen synthase
MMKILLIGPFPPPHGGVSVHVAGIKRDLTAAGIRCQVLSTDRIRWPQFIGSVVRNARRGWTLHLHTNGHNRNSWLLALICGLAGHSGGGGVLTLHSGIAPAYLQPSFPWHRRLARFAASFYRRIICVNQEIRDALESIGVPAWRIAVIPAYTGIQRPDVVLTEPLAPWIGKHRPLLSTTLFFRPEYGFDLLVKAVVGLRRNYPEIGCLVMGSGEDRTAAERRIRDAGLEGNMLLLGDLSHETCLAVMSMSNVFLRTTLRDGDSVSVREALSLGVPVVASRAGTRPEGAILFSPQNLTELVSAVETALEAHTANRNTPVSTGCVGRLIEIYDQAAAPEVKGKGGICLSLR